MTITPSDTTVSPILIGGDLTFIADISTDTAGTPVVISGMLSLKSATGELMARVQGLPGKPLFVEGDIRIPSATANTRSAMYHFVAYLTTANGATTLDGVAASKA